jgi:hypothetical protein
VKNVDNSQPAWLTVAKSLNYRRIAQVEATFRPEDISKRNHSVAAFQTEIAENSTTDVFMESGFCPQPDATPDAGASG